MTSPFDHAWALLKAPIDYRGFSDIPPTPQEIATLAPWAQNPPHIPANLGEENRQEEDDFHDYLKEQGYPQEEEYEQNPDAYRGGYNPPDPNLGGASGVSPKGPSEEEWRRLVDEFNRQRGNETPNPPAHKV